MKAFWVFSFDLRRALSRSGLPSVENALTAPSAVGELARSGLPSAVIEFPREDYDDDYFQCDGFTFVSEKMRRALALDPSEVQYFDVDTSEAPPLPRSKQYQAMHIPVTEYISDPDRSDYTFRQRPDGFELWGLPHAIAFRPDAGPAHEIFYDRFFKVILCTDELALRVLWAGCTGIRFLDPANLDDLGSFFRTLRGVEHARDWDQERNALVPGKLIRAIP
jgi:hypothetical protein